MNYNPLFKVFLFGILAVGISSCSFDSVSTFPALVEPDGSYSVMPLAKDEVVVKVIQNYVRNMEDYDDPQQGLKENLQRMENWVEKACNENPKPDFMLFNEFPLTGYSTRSRDEKLELSITVPGPETKRLGQLAKGCNSYIIFGSYVSDSNWPGHILSINTVINRQGEIAQKYWKTRNIKRFSPDGEIPTTTVEAVFDRYIDMYGPEELFPVLKTEYGNIAVSTVQLDPFVFSAFSMRGVEIMFRTSTLFSREDVMMTARYHDFYSAMCNIIFPKESPYVQYGGDSLIVDPKGVVMAEVLGNDEAIVTAIIPIKKFRENRLIPRYPIAVVRPVISQYVDEIPLNHLDIPKEKLPQDRKSMQEYFDEVSVWLNKK